jgi:uncharacterized membrane-anchored protein YhcB (DUF1043 family)/glutaredoxin
MSIYERRCRAASALAERLQTFSLRPAFAQADAAALASHLLRDVDFIHAVGLGAPEHALTEVVKQCSNSKYVRESIRSGKLSGAIDIIVDCLPAGNRRTSVTSNRVAESITVPVIFTRGIIVGETKIHKFVEGELVRKEGDTAIVLVEGTKYRVPNDCVGAFDRSCSRAMLESRAQRGEGEDSLREARANSIKNLIPIEEVCLSANVSGSSIRGVFTSDTAYSKAVSGIRKVLGNAALHEDRNSRMVTVTSVANDNTLHRAAGIVETFGGAITCEYSTRSATGILEALAIEDGTEAIVVGEQIRSTSTTLAAAIKLLTEVAYQRVPSIKAGASQLKTAKKLNRFTVALEKQVMDALEAVKRSQETLDKAHDSYASLYPEEDAKARDSLRDESEREKIAAEVVQQKSDPDGPTSRDGDAVPTVPPVPQAPTPAPASESIRAILNSEYGDLIIDDYRGHVSAADRGVLLRRYVNAGGLHKHLIEGSIDKTADAIFEYVRRNL